MALAHLGRTTSSTRNVSWVIYNRSIEKIRLLGTQGAQSLTGPADKPYSDQWISPIPTA